MLVRNIPIINSERDTEESHVPSDRDHEESPDETLEKLEALIVH